MRQDVPSWLTKGPREADLDWTRSYKTTMSRLLGAYTLHDSYWVELQLDTGRSGEALLVIRFCADWTKLPASPSEWPLLLIRVPGVRSVTLANHDECYQRWGHWEWREISDAETSLGDDGTAVTTITGFEHETVTIEHSEEIIALCLWENGELVELAELDS